jgi:hypothetical protein
MGQPGRSPAMWVAVLLVSGSPAWGAGVLKVTLASIPSTATRVVAIADGAPVSSPVYATQALTPPAASAQLSMSLPAGNYRVRVLADGPLRSLLASAQLSAQVADGNTTSTFLALAAVSVAVAPSTPSTATAGAPVAIVFNITDWGDVVASANAQLFTSTTSFAVAAGGALAASATPVRVANGSYTATVSPVPATGTSTLYYALRVSISTGSSDSSYLDSPDPATRPQQPWQMPVVAQTGVSITVSQIPASATRIVVIADVPPAAPTCAQQNVTAGTSSATVFIALTANSYRLRVLADILGSSMLASGQTTAAVTSGVTATASVALSAMTVTLDASTPASAAAASAVGIRLNVADAGGVLQGSYAYLWAGLSPFSVVAGGVAGSVTTFSALGQGTLQAAFTVNLPAGAATLYYVLRAQIPVGAGYSQLCSPDPAQFPNSPWQVQTVVTTGVNLSVSGIPSGAVRLVVLADGPLPAVAWTEKGIPLGTTSSSIVVGLPAGVYRLRALVDGVSGTVMATGQTSATAPSSGTGTASVALSVPVVTLSSSTPVSALAGATVTLGFNLVDAGDVIENASSYLYTGSAVFSLVTGGFCLGVSAAVKTSPGHYSVSFSEQAPATAGSFYFETRILVATGLTPSFLDSPDPSAGLPWSVTISLPGTQPCTPTAALMDTATAIRLTTYGSTALQNAGGQSNSDPAAAQGPSCATYVAVRDKYNCIWMATFDPATRSSSWLNAGCTYLGVPAITVARNGVVYMAARDSHGYYWLRPYTPGSGLGSWIFIGGILSSDPAIAASPDGSIYLVGRDTYGYSWSAWYVPGSGFQGWTWESAVIQGKPSITVGTDAYAYLCVRDPWNALWIGRLQGSHWMGWNFGGGVLGSDPQVAATGDGTVYATAVDAWNYVYYRGLREGPAGVWLPWTSAGGKLLTVSAAANPSVLYVVGRDANGDLWWYRSTGNQWTSIGNRGVTTSPLSAAPR